MLVEAPSSFAIPSFFAYDNGFQAISGLSRWKIMKSANSSETTCSDYIFHLFYFPLPLCDGGLRCKFPCRIPTALAKSDPSGLLRRRRRNFNPLTNYTVLHDDLRPRRSKRFTNWLTLWWYWKLFTEKHFPPRKLQADVNVAENHPLRFAFPVSFL